MLIKTDNSGVKIKDLDITVRTKNVLTILEVYTVGDLHKMYVLDTIPKVGTVVRYIPIARVEVTYSRKVNEEVKDILQIYCGENNLAKVGS